MPSRGVRDLEPKPEQAAPRGGLNGRNQDQPLAHKILKRELRGCRCYARSRAPHRRGASTPRSRSSCSRPLKWGEGWFFLRQWKFSTSIRSDPVAVILVYASQWSSGDRDIPKRARTSSIFVIGPSGNRKNIRSPSFATLDLAMK